ncbi:hypothetical protein AAFF_G00244560 [Aldrovandia affinis]|uniref:Uncharacterized protein n=1 Tax=Aldrovandia affinis TaxID=143900 RepID=A0AAD7RDI4_9TELE|nr:hypothetical protein AAFF_G00244560 [Aldrovandia affinis]
MQTVTKRKTIASCIATLRLGRTGLPGIDSLGTVADQNPNRNRKLPRCHCTCRAASVIAFRARARTKPCACCREQQCDRGASAWALISVPRSGAARGTGIRIFHGEGSASGGASCSPAARGAARAS